VSLLRPLTRLLLVLAPLSLVAASAPSDGPPDRREQQRPAPVTTQTAKTVDDWLPLLPAPQTPDAWRPGPGALVAWPLQGQLSQPFGCTGFERERAAQQCPSGFHTGIDLAQSEGTPIRSAGAGLAYPMSDPQRYGNYVVIQQEGGYATVYGHMVRTNVGWGQAVNAGDVIGFVGTTGNSTGPHLHFEVRFGGAPQDPMLYLKGSPPDPFPLPAGWPGSPRDDWRGVR
jgi:murein DD-endopeptidase MepM/ murein hydrolase activator NlpD